MYSFKSLRVAPALRSARLAQPMRSFSLSPAAYVKVGDKIPSTPVTEDSFDKPLDLSKELAHGKNLVIGVPGAFSGGCTYKFVPGYIKVLPDLQAKGFKQVYVVSVNDAFVMNAWKEKHFGSPKNVRFISDASGAFLQDLDLLFDATPVFGNKRSKRFALVVEDGKVTHVFVEPDNTGVDVTAAEKILGTL